MIIWFVIVTLAGLILVLVGDTLYCHHKEIKTHEIHLTIKERLWLRVYNKAFFYDKLIR